MADYKAKGIFLINSASFKLSNTYNHHLHLPSLAHPSTHPLVTQPPFESREPFPRHPLARVPRPFTHTALTFSQKFPQISLKSPSNLNEVI
jgi:hypothetical protein